jgi:hypothetical protein
MKTDLSHGIILVIARPLFAAEKHATAASGSQKNRISTTGESPKRPKNLNQFGRRPGGEQQSDNRVVGAMRR